MRLLQPRPSTAVRRRVRRCAVVALAALVGAPALAPAAQALPSASAPANVLASSRAPAVAVPAAAAGKLTPRGCTRTGTVATCDLWAMTGTATLLGVPVPIWGFSPTGAAGTASAPGPVLVVNQGDSVTVTLHNTLPQAVSLAFPGQPAAAFTAGLGTTTGAGTGQSQTYSFTAGRAGTFVYEAGHTGDGARQVAMGLAGALVVLPGDGSAYGGDAASADTTYDDDAVLVLSEVDPALNAAPTTFDMRGFRPKYRLINGKPFPATDPVSTDQGHKVLLRYVNVGSQSHSMSLLGARQTLVAQDGHLMHYAEPSVAVAVDPGATADSVVPMPTGPEAKVALFEAGGHLDNAGQATADPQQLAFGGMMTFLDTAAPPPSTDGVGPVSSHIAVSPNPSDGLSPVTVTADLSDATTGGSTVTQAELVVDDAVTVGVGFGSPMTGSFGAVDVTGATGTIPATAADCTPANGAVPLALSCLDAGKHTVFVRALDSAGNWGVVGSAVLNLPKTGPATTNGSAADVPANGEQDVTVTATGDDRAAGGTITAAEYFLDTAGAYGTGAPLARNRTASVVSETATVSAADIKALGEGAHHVLVRSKDSLGLWGPTLTIDLPVDTTGPNVDAASVGPNPSNGVLTDKGNPGYLVVSAQITDKDHGGATQGLIADAEGFLDPKVAAPAGGSGFQLVAVDGKLDSSTETVYGLIPISQVKALSDGTHHVSVRGQDDAGNWGDLFAVNLLVDKKAPVLGALSPTPNPTGGAANLTLSAPVDEVSFSAAEFWLGSTDPGAGRGTRVPVSLVNSKIVATVPLTGIAAGNQQVNLRVQDLAGNWSKGASTTVVVQPPNAIFSDTFDSGALTAWSAQNGGVSVTAAAGIPVGGVNRGLQVALPGGAGNRASYVTDTRPNAEPSYHASFSLNADKLTSGSLGTTALTLFEGRTAAAGQVFAVQFHRLASGAGQVRTVMSRSGASTLTGPWVDLTPGAHTMRIDWTSGPATGATSGSLRLLVDGASVQSSTGNTATLRVDSVLLGLPAGVTSTATSSMKGTAYVDSFVSTRYTLP